MRLKKIQHLFVSLLLLLNFFNAAAQEKKDTIYYDEVWSVCEKPVALYYRVCTLNKTNVLFYKGDVKDYYINDKPEMIGSYSDNGYENGEFIFYDTAGSIIKKENYKNGEAFGDWLYYDSMGNLRADFICNSSVDFTPIFLINTNGDTLIKNGSGKFSFDTQKDLPHDFFIYDTYYVTGEVDDSVKNGTFTYSSSFNQGSNAFSETFKEGKFIKAKSYSSIVKEPLKLVHVKENKLSRIDMFPSSNPVFSFNEDISKSLITFLLNGEAPGIESGSKSFLDNDKILFYIIAKVLRASLSENAYSAGFFDFPSSGKIEKYFNVSTDENNKAFLRNIQGDITITMDTAGQIISSAFNTTLTKAEIAKINYYLEDITGLIPYRDDDKKSIKNINLGLKTIIDTLKNNKLRASYIVYNSDSVTNPSFISNPDSAIKNNLFAISNNEQIQAKEPTDWHHYLDQKLNGKALSHLNIANGIYRVTVSFKVDEYGKISDVKADNNSGYEIEQKVINVVLNAPMWSPAVEYGKKIASYQKQIITFQVNRQ